MHSRFEKFTERSRRALSIAHEEALRDGSEAITPRHIALGMLRQEQGVGPRAMAVLGVPPAEMEADLRAGRAGEPHGREIGMDGAAKRAFELAVDEAARAKRTYIGTEHLLVGLMQLGENPLAERLAGAGITISAAREAVAEILGRTEG